MVLDNLLKSSVPKVPFYSRKYRKFFKDYKTFVSFDKLAKKMYSLYLYNKDKNNKRYLLKKDAKLLKRYLSDKSNLVALQKAKKRKLQNKVF